VILRPDRRHQSYYLETVTAKEVAHMTAHRLLDSNASDRELHRALIVAQAIDVLGTSEAAERWLSTPAMGLDQRKPIDLLESSDGIELVKTLLTRMDYGVYA
jgi:putative toxin-antitoxin system antitoxin component (TIGR02293 family)